MKLTYPQLDKHLTTKLSQIYIVSGDEWVLKQEALSAIRKASKQAGFTDHLRLLLETEDEKELHNFLYANSLLGEKQLLEISLRDKLPTKITANLLAEYCQKNNDTNILLIELGKLDARSMKSAWYTALDNSGVIVTVWPVSREQFPQWIKQRAQKNNLLLQEDAVRFITDFTEGNLTAATQIIEKIYLHQPKVPITADLIKTFFNDESRFSIYDLADSLIAKDKVRFIKILKHLAEDRTEPVLILWSLVRELRVLIEMSQQKESGMDFANLCRSYHIFPRRQPVLKSFLATTDTKTCLQLLQRATEIDKFIKGSAQGNVWQMFELFALSI